MDDLARRCYHYRHIVFRIEKTHEDTHKGIKVKRKLSRNATRPARFAMLKMRCSDEMERNFILAGKCRTRPAHAYICRKVNYIVAYLRLFAFA